MASEYNLLRRAPPGPEVYRFGFPRGVVQQASFSLSSTVPGPVAICSFPRDDVPKSPRQCSYLAVMVFFRVRNLRQSKMEEQEKAEEQMF